MTDEFIAFEDPINAVDWLLSRKSLVGTLTKKFFDEYGHRGLNELELMGVPWSENKKQLVDTLKVGHLCAFADTERPALDHA